MQSSGATAFAFLMAQRPDTVAVLDLYCNELAPRLQCEKDVVLKCVASKDYSIDQQIESFQPDKVVLFTRSVEAITDSLSKKPYRDKCGSIDEKLKIYQDAISRKDLFDVEISYEEAIVNRQIEKVGFFIDESAFDVPRQLKDIVEFNQQHCEWCKQWLNLESPRDGKWYFGGLKAEEPRIFAPRTNATIDNEVKIYRRFI
jgi:hypothetical protein